MGIRCRLIVGAILALLTGCVDDVVNTSRSAAAVPGGQVIGFAHGDLLLGTIGTGGPDVVIKQSDASVPSSVSPSRDWLQLYGANNMGQNGVLRFVDLRSGDAFRAQLDVECAGWGSAGEPLVVSSVSGARLVYRVVEITSKRMTLRPMEGPANSCPLYFDAGAGRQVWHEQVPTQRILLTDAEGRNEESTIAALGCNTGVFDYNATSGQTIFGAGCGDGGDKSASGVYLMKLEPGRAEQESRRVTDHQGYVSWSPDGKALLVSGELERPMTLFNAGGRELGQRERLFYASWIRSDAEINLENEVEPELVIE